MGIVTFSNPSSLCVTSSVICSYFDRRVNTFWRREKGLNAMKYLRRFNSSEASIRFWRLIFRLLWNLFQSIFSCFRFWFLSFRNLCPSTLVHRWTAVLWQTLANILKTGNGGPAIKGERKFNSPRTADTQNFSIPYPIEFSFLSVLWFCRFRINCSCFASRRIWILETLSFELCLEVGYARDLAIYTNRDLSVQIWIIRTPPWDLTSSMSSLQANSGSFCFLDCFVLRNLFWFILLYVIALPLFIIRISLSLRYRLFCRLNALDDLYSWSTEVDWVWMRNCFMKH